MKDDFKKLIINPFAVAKASIPLTCLPNESKIF